MTYIIATETEKGGSGKTNTAVSLACGLHNLGKKVVIIDNDPQGGAMRWKSNAGDSKHFPPVALLPKPLVMSDLEAYNADFLIIDGEPGMEIDARLRTLVNYLKSLSSDDRLDQKIKTEINDQLRQTLGHDLTATQSTVAAVKLADLVIVPLKGSDQDAEPAINLVNNIIRPRYEATGKPLFKALINEVPNLGKNPKSTQSLQVQLKQHLINQDIPVFDTQICTREPYRKANTYGLTMYDSNADTKARSEINALTQEVLETLGVNK